MASSVPSESRFDVYRAITEKIVQAIEAGAGEFVMPWHSCGAPITRPANAHTKQRYRGVNVLALWAEAYATGYRSGRWASYEQWKKVGGQVRRGERGTTIVFYRELEQRQPADDDEDAGRRLVARASRVFNSEQVDGWEEPAPEVSDPVEPLAAVEAFVLATGANIRHGGDTACYRIREDLIDMPLRERFMGSRTSTPTEAYYSTLLHELSHWTGAEHRLKREFGTRYGDEAYAVEELVAELGAAFLCADLGIANEPRPDHAAYLAEWLTVLRRDARAVFTAASAANAAAQFLGASWIG